MPTKSAQVVVFVGPARSGKTRHLIERYRTAIEARPPHELGRTIWLAPNGRTAASVRQQFIGSGIGAQLSPGLVTFGNLVAEILRDTGVRLTRLGSVLQRDLVRQIVADALAGGRLKSFANSASRPAFIQAIVNHIAELKRRNIQPELYANTASRAASADAQGELAQLYRDYEAQLDARELVDDESALSTAAEALRKSARPRFSNLDLIIVDGFTDFTAGQLNLLRHLAEQARTVLMSLPADTSSSREELFTKSEATLAQLKREFPQLEVRTIQARSLPNPAVDFLAQHVFRHPKQIPSPGETVLQALQHIEIIEAASAHDEINQIACRVKTLLLTNASPAGILVVFRSLGDVAARAREVFDRFGIPYSLDASRPIMSAPVVKRLLSLLRLAQNDWPFRGVVSVLTNNSFTAFEESARRAAEWLIRDLQIASDRTILLDRIAALAAIPSTSNQPTDHRQRRTIEAKKALPALQILSSALTPLPARATPTQWSEVLANLGKSLGLAPFVKATGDELAANDLAAWQSITMHLATLEQFDHSSGYPTRQISLGELIGSLLEIATNELLPRSRDEAGRVRILSAPAARNTSCRHLFLGGMSEQSFPSPERAGQLAGDADYRRFANASRKKQVKDSTPTPARGNCEMLLFYEVITRASESLTISYPALDDKAQTLPASPYIIELQRVLGDGGTNRLLRRSMPNLSPVPTTSPPLNAAAWRTQALAEALRTDSNCGALAGIFASEKTKPVASSIDAGLRIVHARAHGESFGPCEGLLASPAVAARLAERFGRRHTWSASQWETYAACPFRFFMEQVLGLEPLGDLVLEIDYARRGSRLHDVLAEFHRQWLSICREQSMLPDEEPYAFVAFLRQVIDKRTSKRESAGVDAALLELDRRQIVKWADGHLANQSKYDGTCNKLGVPMTPTHFEFRFGSRSEDGSVADPDSTTAAFEITIDGEPIRITGQIDRIDVGQLAGKTVFNVIDYKSGRRATLKKDQLATGEQLQLPIYVEAAQALVFKGKAQPLQAGYWGMGNGFDSRGALAAPCDDNASRWKESKKAVHNLIADFITHIRHGDFPVASRNEKCTSTCDYNTTCRVGQVRNLEKSWWPEIETGN